MDLSALVYCLCEIMSWDPVNKGDCSVWYFSAEAGCMRTDFSIPPAAHHPLPVCCGFCGRAFAMWAVNLPLASRNGKASYFNLAKQQ